MNKIKIYIDKSTQKLSAFGEFGTSIIESSSEGELIENQIVIKRKKNNSSLTFVKNVLYVPNDLNFISKDKKVIIDVEGKKVEVDKNEKGKIYIDYSYSIDKELNKISISLGNNNLIIDVYYDYGYEILNLKSELKGSGIEVQIEKVNFESFIKEIRKDKYKYGLYYKGKFYGYITLADPNKTIKPNNNPRTNIINITKNFNKNQLQNAFLFTAGSKPRKDVLDQIIEFLCDIVIEDNIHTNPNKKEFNKLFIYGIPGSGKNTIVEDIFKILGINDKSHQLTYSLTSTSPDYVISTLYGYYDSSGRYHEGFLENDHCNKLSIFCIDELQVGFRESKIFDGLLKLLDDGTYKSTGVRENKKYDGAIIALSSEPPEYYTNNGRDNVIRRFGRKIKIPETITIEDAKDFNEKHKAYGQFIDLKKFNEKKEVEANFSKLKEDTSTSSTLTTITTMTTNITHHSFSLMDIVRYYILANYYDKIGKLIIEKKSKKYSDTDSKIGLTYETLNNYYKNIKDIGCEDCKKLIEEVSIKETGNETGNLENLFEEYYKKYIAALYVYFDKKYTLSEEEFNKIFGVTKQTLKNWAGKIDITPQAVENWVNEGVIPSAINDDEFKNFEELFKHLANEHWGYKSLN